MEQLAPLAKDLEVIPPKFWLAVAVYITGLITQHNITATAIAASVGLVSHDHLSRMLQGLGWTLSRGMGLAVRVATALGVPGYLIVDDVLIPKLFSKLIALCYWDYDHSQKRHSYGQRLVFVAWSDGLILIPLAFVFWQKDPRKKTRRRKRRGGKKKGRGSTQGKGSGSKKRRRKRRRHRKNHSKGQRVRLVNGVHYRSKNELARILVWKLVRRGIPCKFILFDNWYASKNNVALFERLKLFWVSRAKSNTRVIFSGQRLSVSQVAALVSKANYHYYAELGARVRSFEVECNGQKLKLTVIKDDPSPESGRTKYLLTNAWWLTNQEHVQWYRKRWIIEVFFRDIKQLVGLTKYEGRTEQGVINHVILVCMAYTFLQLLKPLAKVRRPSVKASKDALAPLVVQWQPSAQVEVVRPKPQGEVQVVSIEKLWHPVRTRLSGLAISENLDLLEFTNL
jgi:hypothetical protein